MLAIVSSCAPSAGGEADAAATPIAAPFIQQIRWSFWSAPFESRLLLHADGRAWRETGSSQANQKDRPPTPTTCEVGRFDPAHWAVLAREIEAGALCALKDRYDNPLINDAPFCVTSFVCDGRLKAVVDYAEQAPRAMRLFESMVAEAAQRAAWQPFAGTDAEWQAQTGWTRGQR